MKRVTHKLVAGGAQKEPRVIVDTPVRSAPCENKHIALWGIVARTSFLRNVSVLTLAGLVGAAITLGQGIVVARLLQPELYGVAVLIMSYPNLIYGILDARSGDVSVKYLSEAYVEKNRDRSLAICKFGYVLDLLLAIVAFAAVAITAPWAAVTFVKNVDVADLIVITAAAFVPAALVRTSQATMTSLGRFDVLGWTDVVAKIVRAAAVLVLVLAGWKLEGVIWGNAIGLAVSGLLYAFTAGTLTVRHYGATALSGRWSALRGRRREILRFLAYNDLTVLVAIIPRELDVLALGHFRGVVEVSYYKLAKSFSSLTGYLASPLQSVVYPELVKLWSRGGGASAVNLLIREVMLKLGLPIGVGCLFVVLLVPVIVPTLVGQSFQNAVFSCQILFVASSLTLIFFWLRPFFLTKAQYRIWFLCSGGVTLLLAPTYLFFVPAFGHDGAALWYLTLQVVGILTALVYIKASQ